MSIEKLQQGFILPTKVVVTEQLPPTEKVTQSGIVIPQLKKNPQMTGKIVLVGAGTPTVKMEAKVGLMAIFTPLSAQKFTFEGEDFLLLEQSNILFMFSE